MRIAVIEIDYHSEVLRNFIEVFANSEFRLQIFTTKKIWFQTGLTADSLNIEVFTVQKRSEIPTFFRNHETKINDNDLVIFNTLASFYRFFTNFPFAIPVLVRIHNVNSYFQPLKHLQLATNWDEVVYDFRHIFWKTIGQLDIYHRSKFVKTVTAFLFPSEQMAIHARSGGLVQANRVIEEPFPQTYSQKIVREGAVSDSIVICVAGTVERKRRDYDLLVRVFKKSAPQFKVQVNLVLLGILKGDYGKRIEKDFQNISTEKFQVTTFTEYVSNSEFDEYMRASKFLIFPIRINTRYQIYSETYGKSKISGAELDIIKYQKRAIIPDDYQISKDLEFAANSYKNEDDLSALITKWVNGDVPRLGSDFEKYHPEQICRKVGKVFKGFVRD